MKPKKDRFTNIDEDWIHTEVLGQRSKASGFFYNLIIFIVLVCAIILLVIAFQGMSKNKDLRNLEGLEEMRRKQESQKEKEEDLIQKEEVEKKEEVEELVYIVEPGDTLAYIGLEFDVEWKKIAERNGLEEPYDLEVGQELIIPGVKKPVEEPVEDKTVDLPGLDASGNTYTVQSGDTLAGIGMELNISWESMADLNGIEEPYALDIGQVLELPAE